MILISPTKVMIEYALDKFPVRHALNSGVQCLIRPFEPDDAGSFQLFNHAIPEKERFLIKHRVGEDAHMEEWCQNLDFEKHLPLLALADGRIVGYATLHQRPSGWKRHIGMVGALVHPEYRGRVFFVRC